MFHVTTILIPPHLIPPLTRLKGPKGHLACRPRQKPPCPHRRACGAPLQTSARAHIRLPPRPDLPQLPGMGGRKKPLHGARRPPALSLATRMTRMVSQTSGSSPSSRARRPTTARPSTSCGGAPTTTARPTRRARRRTRGSPRSTLCIWRRTAPSSRTLASRCPPKRSL